jgi:uroporphyrin-III C-methyltransferase
MTVGTVYLVGAGPGDPRLLTLRGAEVLRQADVVVHDRLAPAALLDLAPARAERVDVGKTPGKCIVGQDEINVLLVERARRGETVVRLKGGDPFVFGRGGEEALELARAGVPFEVVPGVSSVVAAPAYAGIPLTHRGLSASFAVVTASLTGGASQDLSRMATAVDTLVVLMAAGKLEQVTASLIEAGRDSKEPSAIVSWATTSDQRTVIAPLSRLAEEAREAAITAPATLVVGAVVGLAEALDWFRTEELVTPAAARSM